MENGAIDMQSLPGGFNLRLTLESGQSYGWRRVDGEMFDGLDGATYETVADGLGIRISQEGDDLHWRATDDATETIERLLRLDDDLEHIYSTLPDDPLLDRAIGRYRGMRLVREPVFRCLISFICSAQMRVERIYRMQRSLAEAYGDEIALGDVTIHAFPSADQLAEATEAELRELGLGYRAPYVLDTARMVASGDAPQAAGNLEYESAREYLTRYIGVGEKVSDCVLLFSLDFLEAVPLDTWIRTAIESNYPGCDRDTYAETSRAIRQQFGGTYAGYAQTYVFHALRTGDISNPEART